MFKFVNRLLLDTKAATAVEYGLIVALLALSALVAISETGNVTGNMWNTILNKSDEAIAKTKTG